MTHDIRLLDVVALTIDKPEHKLTRGEIGAVVECYPDNTYEVEFVAQDGFTYALVTIKEVNFCHCVKNMRFLMSWRVQLDHRLF